MIYTGAAGVVEKVGTRGKKSICGIFAPVRYENIA